MADLCKELLARAHPDEFDLDVLVRLKPAQLDHLPRQVHDLDRLAHVEHENLAADPLGGALQHQHRSLRDGHEITGDLRVRHFDGAPVGDLLLEEGDDAAGGAEDVAKADRHELGLVRVRVRQ